jgi:long-chain acyl-CoA synthetase
MSDFDSVFTSMPSVWENNARNHGAKDAVVCGERRVSWSDFNRMMNRVADALLRRGIRKGDRVALAMDSSVEQLVIMFGILKSGACAVPLSPMLTSEQLGVLLRDANPRLAFLSAATRALADLAGRDGWLPAGSWIGVGFTGEGWTPYEAFLEGAADTNPLVDLRAGDPCLIIYSSGTTGLPKGILQTHYSRMELAVSCALEMRFDLRARALVSTGIHSTGTYLMMGPTFLVGGTLIILPQFTPAALLALVARERVTHTFLVPAQFLALLASPELPATDLSSLRCMLSAGSPLRNETKLEILARMGPALFELYGASEGIATMMKPEQREGRLASVGQPMIGHELRVIGDDDQEVRPGERGEIVGHAPSLLHSYFGKPAAVDAAIWRDERGRTFFRTGDIGWMDEERFFTIVDRKKDMIISGGYNVYPVDIEAVIAGHEAVFDVTVLGVPHAKWGETPLALVIAKPGVTMDVEELRTWANERLAKYQRVSRVELRTDFPRNALGKVQKRELRLALPDERKKEP